MSLPVKTYLATAPCKVAFLGLGVMGAPMAKHLAMAGHRVTVYNRNTAKAQAWVAEMSAALPAGHAANHAATPRLAVAQADIVFSCVGNDDSLRSITLGSEQGTGQGTGQDIGQVDG